MTLLLDHDAQVDHAHPFALTTALHFAAEMGREAVLRLLCAAGANPEAKKTTGGTALHTASDTNQTASVRVLVEDCGSNIHSLLHGDTTPLYLAAQRGFTEVCEALLLLGANVNFAMPRGQYKKDIMLHGADEGSASWYGQKNTELGNGATALHAAVENGHEDTSRLLLKHGAKQSNSMEGATPLIIAIQYKHPHIALLLLENHKQGWDASLDTRVPKDGTSAVLAGAAEGYATVVEQLLRMGASPDLPSRGGATALQVAIQRGHSAVVGVLLAHRTAQLEGGEDTDWKKDSKRTKKRTKKSKRKTWKEKEKEKKIEEEELFRALLSAVERGHVEMVKVFLLDRGVLKAKLAERIWGEGYTLLHVASGSPKGKHFDKITRMLLSAGADPNVQVH